MKSLLHGNIILNIIHIQTEVVHLVVSDCLLDSEWTWFVCEWITKYFVLFVEAVPFGTETQYTSSGSLRRKQEQHELPAEFELEAICKGWELLEICAANLVQFCTNSIYLIKILLIIRKKEADKRIDAMRTIIRRELDLVNN